MRNLGGVATKSAYNLLGGQVDFDIDLSGVHTGVNAVCSRIYDENKRVREYK